MFIYSGLIIKVPSLTSVPSTSDAISFIICIPFCLSCFHLNVIVKYAWCSVKAGFVIVAVVVGALLLPGKVSFILNGKNEGVI